LERFERLEQLEQLRSSRSNSSIRSIRSTWRIPSIHHLVAQLLGCSCIEFELSAVLLNHHAIVTSGRVNGNIAGPNIGKNALCGTIERTPEPSAAGGLDQKPITLVYFRGFDFPGWESLKRSVTASN
jgi:hypothetical protein